MTTPSEIHWTTDSEAWSHSAVPKQAHQLVNQDSGNSEWFTPPEIIEAAREVMGTIDLDPASCEAANRLVKAARYFAKTHDEDGLSETWFSSHTWVNWPFGKGTNALWVNKILHEYRVSCEQQEICCICFAATSEVWFRPLLAYPQCFLHGRTNYLDPITLKPVKGVTKGSVVTYLGPNISCFAEVFSKLGTVKICYKSTLYD